MKIILIDEYWQELERINLDGYPDEVCYIREQDNDFDYEPMQTLEQYEMELVNEKL